MPTRHSPCAKAYAAKPQVQFTAFPSFETSGELDEAFLNVAKALVQSWLEENLHKLPTAAERVVFGRALEVNLAKRTEKAVPQSAAARAAALAAGASKIALNAAATKMTNVVRSSEGQKEAVMTDENIAVIVELLTKMRGATLKLAQKINSMRAVLQIDARLQEALDRHVLNKSMAMPAAQVQSVLAAELGADWSTKLSFFNPTAFAAASIGQVHTATVGEDDAIVLKVQFPGVKESISSDLDSMLTLMGVTMKRGSRALEQNAHTFKGYKAAWLLECDYRLEAANLKRYASLVAADADAAYWDEKFEVPTLIDALCAERVIAQAAAGAPAPQSPEALVEASASSGLLARPVAKIEESLAVMIRGEAAVCCVLVVWLLARSRRSATNDPLVVVRERPPWA